MLKTDRTVILEQAKCPSHSTSRERPKSAIYLILKKREVFKIVKRGPFGLFEDPVCGKIGQIEGMSIRTLLKNIGIIKKLN